MKIRLKATYLVLIALASACSVGSGSYDNDYTYLYDQKESLIKPEFKIFHHSADSSRLYFQVNSSDVLYSKIDGDTLTKSLMMVKYKLRSFDNKNTLIDSATYPLIDYGLNKADAIIQSQLNFKCASGNQYYIEIRLRDQFKDLNVVHFLIVDKRENGNKQYYLVKSGEKVLPNQIAVNSNKIVIEKSPLLKEDHFLIQYESKSYKKAFPPFAMSRLNEKILEADATDSIRFSDNKLQLTLDANVTRLIPVNSDDETANSLYVRYYYDGFPEITQLEQMLEPIRFISTTNEYNNIIESSEKRKAFEAFWLQLAKNENSAKALIREYYGRIETANRFFSSFKPGWKTDRGIIFIVYGEPYRVEKTFNNEIWYYGEDNNILSVKFQFNKIQTDWSSNDFELLRDQNYKNNWYRAVDVWRQGRIN